MEGKIYSPVGKFTKRAKLVQVLRGYGSSLVGKQVSNIPNFRPRVVLRNFALTGLVRPGLVRSSVVRSGLALSTAVHLANTCLPEKMLVKCYLTVLYIR